MGRRRWKAVSRGRRSFRFVTKESAPPVDEGTRSHGDDKRERADSDEVERLKRARESYQEVLAATKHEDDKVGRFLATIAFLVAGALLFSGQPGLLGARYDLGTTLALPAISLAAFLFSVTLSVLLYVLAIAAPLTRPVRQRSDRSHSKLFFLQIAEETEDSWRASWAHDPSTLRQDLREQYIEETRNLGYRAYVKRSRSTEASGLFSVALLFFGLTVGFALHAATRSAENGVYPWSLGVQVPVAIGLALFALFIAYQRYASDVVQRVENRARGEEHLGGSYAVMAGLPILIGLLILSPPGAGQAWRGVAAIFAFVLVLVVLVGWWSTRGSQAQGSGGQDQGGGRRIVLGGVGVLWLALGAVAAISMWEGDLALRLLIAVIVAVSPLGWQLAQSLIEPGRLREARRMSQRAGTVEQREEPEGGADFHERRRRG